MQYNSVVITQNSKLITGKTKLLGVIGYPVEHSLSPVMHNAALASLGVDYIYLPLPVSPADLSTALAGLSAIGFLGFNVTIPHKQTIIPLLSEVSPVAQAVGAVNTVYRTPNGWAGTNTDIQGFLAPLLKLERDWGQTTAVILGIGGASRAVVAGCAQLGIHQIAVVGRSRHKLAAFQQSWLHSSISINLSTHTLEELPHLLCRAQLLVNATPVGMYPKVDETPVTAAEMAHLPAGAIVYDLIYTPNPTLFLQIAADCGAYAIDGLEMLVQQGAAALEIWLQQPVPADVMRQSLRQHLGLTP